MKRNALLSIVAIAVTLFLASCATDYDATPTIPGKENIRNPFQGDFTAMLNDENFTASNKYVYDSMQSTYRMLAIIGQQFHYNMDTTRSKSISFTIYPYEGPKTYYMPGIAGVYSNVDSNITYNYMSSLSDTLASITVTSDQTSYEGTFNLMAIEVGGGNDTIHISQGQFKIPK